VTQSWPSGDITLTVPTSVAPGSYYVIVCADDLKKVAESDETDNCKTYTDPSGIDQVFVTRPNLQVNAVSNPPATTAPGASFFVSVTTKNAVSVETLVATATRFYLSANATKGSGDKLLTGTRTVPAGLKSPNTDSASMQVGVPSSTAPGPYYLIACADDQKKITETDETDNCKASASPVQVGLPDLVVDAVTNPIPAVGPGGTFQVTVTTKNQGAVVAAASKTRFYFSVDTSKSSGDRLLTGMQSVGILSAGNSVPTTLDVTVPTSMPLGTYRLLACADDEKKVAESNETNNCKASTTTVNVSRPDLVVSALNFIGAVSVPPGGVVQVFGETTNHGIVAAGASTTQFWLSLDQVKSSGDKLLVGSAPVPALPPTPGLNYALWQPQLTVPSSTNPGTYYVIACADASSAVTELVETNNCTASAGAFVTVTP